LTAAIRFLDQEIADVPNPFFSLTEPSHKITGGAFFSNNADFGGFLYKKGAGSVSCTGASAERNQAVDGGGVYAVENATLSWSCDLVGNSALSGPAV